MSADNKYTNTENNMTALSAYLFQQSFAYSWCTVITEHSWCGTCKPYLYSSAAIGKLVKTVRQFGFFSFNKVIVKCLTMKLLKAMDRVLKVCYDL